MKHPTSSYQQRLTLATKADAPEGQPFPGGDPPDPPQCQCAGTALPGETPPRTPPQCQCAGTALPGGATPRTPPQRRRAKTTLGTVEGMPKDRDKPVVLSRIYTKTGDEGTTALG